MPNWPESLIIELAARRCIIFLGAGASFAAKRTDGTPGHPPNWEGFLQILEQKSTRGQEADLELIRKFITEKQFLDAAEILRAVTVYPAEYNRILGETFERYRPSEVHRLVEVLDQKIVVTTNYDTLYEDHCRQGDASHGYAVLNYFDDGLVARMRSPKHLIIKLHGSVSNPEKTVLSKSDYFKARAESTGFFKTMESLFLTNTLLFVGYSVSDPDIQLLLENSTITAPSDHPHYALMPAGMHPAMREAFKRTYNIEILEFNPENDFEEFLTSLQELAEQVDELRDPQPVTPLSASVTSPPTT